jgi:hypothetical protein
MEVWVTENSANTESWVLENPVNTENWVIQDSGGGGGKKPKQGKCTAPSKRPAPRWCPRDNTNTQKCRLQKIRQIELAEKKEEEERDYWFNRLWRWEKWLAKEEGCSGSNNM